MSNDRIVDGREGPLTFSENKLSTSRKLVKICFHVCIMNF